MGFMAGSPPLSMDPVLRILELSIFTLLGITLLFALATLIQRIRNDAKAGRWARLESRWETTILDYLAEGQSPDGVLALVDKKDELYFVGYILRFAQRLRGEERGGLEELARPFLPAIACQAGSSSDERRARAIQTLGALGLPAHLDLLREALADPSPLVAMLAAQGLCGSRNPDSLEPVLLRLARFREWDPSFVSGMLAGVGPDAGPALEAVLVDRERSGWARAVVAESLRSLNLASASGVAASVLRDVDQTPPDLAVACLRLLSAVGHPDHRDAVLPWVTAREAEVRGAAISALGQMGLPQDAELVEEALADPSPWVVLEAARGLRALSGEEALARVADSHGTAGTVALQVLGE